MEKKCYIFNKCYKEYDYKILTSSYMNCRVRADLPTPPLPTIITLCITDGALDFGLDMIPASYNRVYIIYAICIW